MFKKDQFIFGFIVGLIAPFAGFAIFKYWKLSSFSFAESFNYLIHEDGHYLLTVAITLSLVVNILLFTIFVNKQIDKTAKGIFTATIIYTLLALGIKIWG